MLPLSAVAPKIKEELYTKALNERFAKWLKTDLRRKHRVDVKIAGVVFKPEDSTESMVDSLMAKSTRTSEGARRSSVLSYLNPFSYISKETALRRRRSQEARSTAKKSSVCLACHCLPKNATTMHRILNAHCLRMTGTSASGRLRPGLSPGDSSIR